MDFVSLILFLMMYYVRPQEWYGFLSSLHPIQLTMILAIFGLVSRDPRLKLRDFFRTPHDWLMAAYFLWSIFASPTPWATFVSIQSVIMVYFLGVVSLNSIRRMKIFLGFWLVFVLFIAALAVASAYGFDPLESYEITQGRMKGRLVLNLSVFRNPNTLAHSIVAALPMIFYLMYWKKILNKGPAIALCIIPLWCVFLTQSKGAFLCTFATIVATLTFGRSKAFQIAIVAIAGTMGVGALYMLPRMNELEKAKADGAIQGRVAAFTFGRQCLSESWRGIGLSNFQNEFKKRGPLEYIQKRKVLTVLGSDGRTRSILQPQVGTHYKKACHSSYNQNGSELGYPGFFLFIALMYACMRTIITAKTKTDDEERIRRILFVLVLSYAISSWMVDFGYRPTFFLFIAATGAFHRHLLGLHEKSPETEEEERNNAPALTGPARPSFIPQNSLHLPVPGFASAAPASAGMTPMQVSLMPPPPPPGMPKLSFVKIRPVAEEEPGETQRGTITWVRFGFIDFALSLVLVKAAVMVWDHAIKAM
jgi:hypothetical protein